MFYLMPFPDRIHRLTRLTAEELEDQGATELGVTFTDTSWFTGLQMFDDKALIVGAFVKSTSCTACTLLWATLGGKDGVPV